MAVDIVVHRRRWSAREAAAQMTEGRLAAPGGTLSRAVDSKESAKTLVVASSCHPLLASLT